MVEGVYTDKPMSAHNDHIHSHKNTPGKVWTDFCVAVKLHPNNSFSLAEYIKNISPDMKMEETYYFITMRVTFMMLCCMYGIRPP